jgi:hypothetical protein
MKAPPRVALAGAAITAAGVGFAGTANASPVSPYNNEDMAYYDLLQEPPYPVMIYNFPLLVRQAHWACATETAGATSDAAIAGLMEAGPYEYPVARGIVLSAEVAYCPWNH